MKGRGYMKKFGDAEKKKIAQGVKKASEKYGLHVEKKDSKSSKK